VAPCHLVENHFAERHLVETTTILVKTLLIMTSLMSDFTYKLRYLKHRCNDAFINVISNVTFN
jgi:hypothetical protein